MFKLIKIGFYVVLLNLTALHSQSLHYGGIFPTIDHSADISDKIEYDFYYFAAFPLINFKKPQLNKDASFLLFYSEQSLSYKLNNKLSLTASYVYQRANVVYNDYINENRFYIQAKYKHAFKKINLTHRLRFDGRFIKNQITQNTPFTHRLRYLIGVEIPMKTKTYFTAYEELFFNTVKNATTLYEENWAYAALGLILNKKNKVEAGLLHLTWNIGKTNWFNQYYLQLTWINHLDFRKNES